MALLGTFTLPQRRCYWENLPGINDDVTGYVEVGDALAGVDHGKARPGGVYSLKNDSFLIKLREIKSSIMSITEIMNNHLFKT